MREALSTSKIIKSKRQPPNLKKILAKQNLLIKHQELHIKSSGVNAPIVPSVII